MNASHLRPAYCSSIAILAANLFIGVLLSPIARAEVNQSESAKKTEVRKEKPDEFGEIHQHILHRRFKKAAEKARILAVGGHPKAQTVMGMLYQYGLGVEKDVKVAIYWLEKAADQGLCEAESYLGDLYKDGVFVEKDWDKAEMWLSKAAKHGQREAQVHLGLMYLDTKWAKRDVKHGEIWLREAALHDSEEAKQALEKVPGVKTVEKRTRESKDAYSQGLYNIKDSWAGYGDIVNSMKSVSAGAASGP